MGVQALLKGTTERKEAEEKLVYENDGIGVPNDEKEKIFKEGYGKGTGYGLYLIKKSVQRTAGPSKKQANHEKEPNSQ